MSLGWENHEPAPIEFLHSRIINLFHEWRKKQTEDYNVIIDGNSLNNIIADAKTQTYEKYKKLELQKNILKTEL